MEVDFRRRRVEESQESRIDLAGWCQLESARGGLLQYHFCAFIAKKKNSVIDRFNLYEIDFLDVDENSGGLHMDSLSYLLNTLLLLLLLLSTLSVRIFFIFIFT